jgi:hypothetical protein
MYDFEWIVKINYLFRHNKIDAEGLDLEVLKGASNYFGKTEIFMVEAGVYHRI